MMLMPLLLPMLLLYLRTGVRPRPSMYSASGCGLRVSHPLCCGLPQPSGVQEIASFTQNSPDHC